MRSVALGLCLFLVGCAASTPRSAATSQAASERASLRRALLACHEKNRDACFVAAAKLEDGSGTRADADGAARAWQASCSLGEPKACALLAFRLEHGRGGYPKDRPRAARLYQEACRLDEEVGCIGYGRALLLGWQGRPDPERAVHVWTQACLDGHKLGCAAMGKLLAKLGHREEAGALYRRACMLGLKQACGEPDAALPLARVTATTKRARRSARRVPAQGAVETL